MLATKTSVDSYMTFLIMENKEISKIVLNEQEVRVPAGQQFSSLADATAAFEHLKDTNLVLKPSTTNFGIGISFLESPIDKDLYR